MNNSFAEFSALIIAMFDAKRRAMKNAGRARVCSRSRLRLVIVASIDASACQRSAARTLLSQAEQTKRDKSTAEEWQRARQWRFKTGAERLYVRL